MPSRENINRAVSSGAVGQSEGDESFPDDVTVADDATVGDDLTVTGDITFGGTLLSARQQTETVAANKTLDAGDSGVVQIVTADAKVITLPATALGLSYTIVNGGADGAVLVTVSPAAADKIVGNGFTAADDKDILNTKATAKRGDMVRLLGDGADGWYVQEIRGTWARE